MTTLDISRDAQTILQTAWNSSGDLGAILRTVADLVAPEIAAHRRGIRERLLALAEELQDF